MSKTILKVMIVFSILGLSALVAFYFVKNPAITEKKEIVESNNIQVTTETVTIGTYPVKIELMGQVIPAHETALKSQVSGKIIKVSPEFIPGGFIKKDEVILQIDPTDYELDIKIKKSLLRQANAALKLELGQQKIAQKELEIIKQSTGKSFSGNSLALRKPQLEQARANIAAAQAQLEISELNLSRTKITAPFNALISKRLSDLGNVTSPQEVLAILVNIDEYWIDVETPVHNIRWLETGAKAIISFNSNYSERTGSLLKITGFLNQDSRLAHLIISAPNPLQGSPLILQDYVRVILIGKTINDAAKISLSYLHDNNSVWIMREGKLVITPVVIVHEDRKFAYITKGIAHNDQIITSNIITPINGMTVEIAK